MIRRGMLALLVLTLAPAAIGCVGSSGSRGSVTAPPDSSSKPNAETQTSVRGAVPIGQPIVTRDGYNLTVQDPAFLKLWHPPLTGDRFWVVRIRACAPPSNRRPVLAFSDEYRLTLNDGDELHPLLTPEREPSFTSGAIRPGHCAAGWLMYEVPSGTSPVALRYGSHRFDVHAT